MRRRNRSSPTAAKAEAISGNAAGTGATVVLPNPANSPGPSVLMTKLWVIEKGLPSTRLTDEPPLANAANTLLAESGFKRQRTQQTTTA